MTQYFDNAIKKQLGSKDQRGIFISIIKPGIVTMSAGLYKAMGKPAKVAIGVKPLDDGGRAIILELNPNQTNTQRIRLDKKNHGRYLKVVIGDIVLFKWLTKVHGYKQGRVYLMNLRPGVWAEDK